ncbi:9640_t:CDS:2 [Entrophospora sp. SA101]|nr:9640_t:CDS:2 [Entrophospora sp. SA101]
MSYKLVVLGDINVGKTAFTIQTSDSTTVVSYKKQVVIDDQLCVLDVLEAAGQGRKKFKVSNDNYQIVRIKGSKKIPLILVGNKCGEHVEQEISKEEGMNMAKRLGCEFFESSAKTSINIERPFYTVVQMIRQKEEKRFKNQIKREHILFHNYNSFQNIEFIDDGSFGTISRASSKHHHGLVALKSINIDQKYTFEQLINEAKQHHKVELHSNILRFYGITKESVGHAPFADKSITSKCIIVAIILGERETIIKGTPKKYAEIYTACWQGKPDLRPHIHEVMQDLDSVDITNTVEDIVDQTNNELQIDGLLNSTEPSFSAQIDSLNNHLREGKLKNDLLYSTEFPLSA